MAPPVLNGWKLEFYFFLDANSFTLGLYVLTLTRLTPDPLKEALTGFLVDRL